MREVCLFAVAVTVAVTVTVAVAVALLAVAWGVRSALVLGGWPRMVSV